MTKILYARSDHGIVPLVGGSAAGTRARATYHSGDVYSAKKLAHTHGIEYVSNLGYTLNRYDSWGSVSKNLDKTARRFVGEALYGILSSQSVMLTEIGRSLQTQVSLKKIEDRFCRQLAKEGIWQTIHRQVLADAAPRIKEDTLLILDLSNLTKKYARKMQYMARVRDGSEGGELSDGYWTTQVVGAELGSQQLLPLYQELYSQKAPDFVSENTQIIRAIDRIAAGVANRGIWVIDRGGDRRVLFDRLLAGPDKNQFIVRLGDRHLISGGHQETALSLAHRSKLTLPI